MADDKDPHPLEHVPTVQQRADAKAYSHVGVPQKDIAKKLGIALSTLQKHYREELDEGLASAHTLIAGELMKLIKKGNQSAVIFAAKTRLGMVEVQRHRHGGDEEAPPIEINHSIPNNRADLALELQAMGVPVPASFFQKTPANPLAHLAPLAAIMTQPAPEKDE